jgi:hypothetical protein
LTAFLNLILSPINCLILRCERDTSFLSDGFPFFLDTFRRLSELERHPNFTQPQKDIVQDLSDALYSLLLSGDNGDLFALSYSFTFDGRNWIRERTLPPCPEPAPPSLPPVVEEIAEDNNATTEADDPLAILRSPADDATVKAVEVNQRPSRAAKRRAQELKLWELYQTGKPGDVASRRWALEKESRRVSSHKGMDAAAAAADDKSQKRTDSDADSGTPDSEPDFAFAQRRFEQKEASDAAAAAAAVEQDEPEDEEPVCDQLRASPYDRILREDWTGRVQLFFETLLRNSHSHLLPYLQRHILLAALGFWLGAHPPSSLDILQHDARIYWSSLPRENPGLTELGSIALKLVYAALSEASCERVFSHLKDVAGDDRGSLGRSALENLIRLRCMKDDITVT